MKHLLLLVAVFAVAIPGRPVRADWPLFRGNELQDGIAQTTLPDQLDVIWKIKLDMGIESTAAIVKDTAYVGCFDDHMRALDLKTGQEKWKYKADPFRASPAVRAGLVYIGDSEGRFHCVEAATGKKRWAFETTAEIVSGPNFAGEAVLFAIAPGCPTYICRPGPGRTPRAFRPSTRRMSSLRGGESREPRSWCAFR